MPKPEKKKPKRGYGAGRSTTGREREKRKSAVNGQTVVANNRQTQGK